MSIDCVQTSALPPHHQTICLVKIWCFARAFTMCLRIISLALLLFSPVHCSVTLTWSTYRKAHPVGCLPRSPCSVEFVVTEVRLGRTDPTPPPSPSAPTFASAAFRLRRQTQRSSVYGPLLGDPTASGFAIDFGDGSSSNGTLMNGAVDPLLQLRLRTGSAVHAYSSTTPLPATYTATMRLCCRPIDVVNNGGADIFLQVFVIVTEG